MMGGVSRVAAGAVGWVSPVRSCTPVAVPSAPEPPSKPRFRAALSMCRPCAMSLGTAAFKALFVEAGARETHTPHRMWRDVCCETAWRVCFERFGSANLLLKTTPTPPRTLAKTDSKTLRVVLSYFSARTCVRVW